MYIKQGWDPVNRFNHTSWVAIVTPTDRPKSVRNRCVIEILVPFYVVTLFFGFFFGCRGFCDRTESDLFLFLLWLVGWIGSLTSHSIIFQLYLSRHIHVDVQAAWRRRRQTYCRALSAIMSLIFHQSFKTDVSLNCLKALKVISLCRLGDADLKNKSLGLDYMKSYMYIIHSHITGIINTPKGTVENIIWYHEGYKLLSSIYSKTLEGVSNALRGDIQFMYF